MDFLYFILENKNGITENFELTYFLDYQKFNDELSPLNHPELNRHFLLTKKQELKIIYNNSDFPIMNTIIFPLKANENIIDIQLASYNSYGKAALVLTNNGRIFGIKDGFKDQKESNEPIQFNHFIGLKTSFEDITQIMQLHQKNINIGKPIDSWNHPELFHNDYFLLYETISNNFVKLNEESFYTREKIKNFFIKTPEKGIDLLHLNLKAFEDPKENRGEPFKWIIAF